MKDTISEHERRQRILNALPLIRAVALKMHRRLRFLDLEELMSIGLVTLHDAVRKFDPTRASFRAYLVKRLFWAMTSAAQRHHRRFNPDRGLPTGIATRYLHDRTRQVRVTPVQDESFLPSVLEFRSDRKPGAVTNAGDLSDTAVSDTEDPEQNLIRRGMDRRLKEAIAALPHLEERIVTHHYFEGESFAAIAVALGKSKPQVSRLHKRALERLAELLREHGIEIEQLFA